MRPGNNENSKTKFDITKCEAQDMSIDKFCECLIEKPYLHQCEYYISYGGGFFCKHPNRVEIIRHTNRKIRK